MTNTLTETGMGLIHLLKRVWDGEMSLEEFYTLRLDLEQHSMNITRVLDDAEDAIVHLPAKVGARVPELEEMRETFEGGMLEIYLFLLERGISIDKGLSIREVLWKYGVRPRIASQILSILSNNPTSSKILSSTMAKTR